MQSFDEFISTISDEDFNDMLVKAAESVDSYKDVSLATKFNDMNLLQTIMILRRYHDWLSKQL